MTTATTVRERPLLMSAPMVRATLRGDKTQTRRVVGLDAETATWADGLLRRGGVLVLGADGYGGLRAVEDSGAICSIPFPRCRYGAPGDRLWVREAWSAQYEWPENYRGNHVAWHHKVPPAWRLGSNAMRTYYRADRSMYDVYDLGAQGIDLVRHRSHGEAPQWVPSIHMPQWASRLTLEITGVRVERVQDISEADAVAEGVDAVSLADIPRQATRCRRDDFAQLWNKLNAGRGFGWDVNPWVWVLSFRRVEDRP